MPYNEESLLNVERAVKSGAMTRSEISIAGYRRGSASISLHERFPAAKENLLLERGGEHSSSCRFSCCGFVFGPSVQGRNDSGEGGPVAPLRRAIA